MQERLEDSYWRRHRRLKIAKLADDVETKQLVSTLEATSGVLSTAIEDASLAVEYDLREINLRAIRAVISEHKSMLNESVWEKIRRGLIEYKEAIRQEEQYVDYGWDTWVQDAYVSRYRLRRHGQRDDRLTNWRQYEANHQIKNAKNDPSN